MRLAWWLSVVFAACAPGGPGPGTDAGPPDAGSDAGSNVDAGPEIPQCPAGAPWDRLPVEPAELSGITPLGNLNPPAHTLPSYHTYMVPTRVQGVPQQVTLRFPGDGWIDEVLKYEELDAGLVEYSIHFTPCALVHGYFDHVRNLEPSVLAKLEPFPAAGCNTSTFDGHETRTCWKRTLQPISSGEIVSRSQGQTDFGARDGRAPPLGFVRPERFPPQDDGNARGQTVCPYEYFPPALRDQALALMGNPFWDPPRRRSVEPRCGTIMQDVPGTAAGVWFADPVDPQSSLPKEDRSLSLVASNFDGTTPVISIGTFSNVGVGAYVVSPPPGGVRVNCAFTALTPTSGPCCYEALTDLFGVPKGQGVVLLELASSGKLKVERQPGAACGSGPWAFTGAAVEFER